MALGQALQNTSSLGVACSGSRDIGCQNLYTNTARRGPQQPPWRLFGVYVFSSFFPWKQAFWYTPPNLFFACWGTWVFRTENTFGVYFCSGSRDISSPQDSWESASGDGRTITAEENRKRHHHYHPPAPPSPFPKVFLAPCDAPKMVIYNVVTGSALGPSPSYGIPCAHSIQFQSNQNSPDRKIPGLEIVVFIAEVGGICVITVFFGSVGSMIFHTSSFLRSNPLDSAFSLWETDFYTPPVLGGVALFNNSAPAVFKDPVP